ncbi:MAG TPA: glycoside hydrolase family 88 protein [Bacteroidales bacterium]|nr:glycoside hydrolase family 88 protein [Bacteroidales bacterium]HOK74915.1 glycoside hydrolase family 88 protein [Bacteroidales bacterium]HOM41225.1 glycoside hydrolase family 88 protein [Bacteroidales bacterium]HPP93262.1 glycoside hydrolase family 88 protein [Bacteroidales bacterium]HRR17299.1 glycoside hydrolase family 88 protein [Bacteroidales bacterium]
MKKISLTLFITLFSLISLKSFTQPVVALDNWFNRETNPKTGQLYHYLWTDTAWSGYSRWGEIFKGKGAVITTIEKPAADVLKNINVYIIVDPDTTTESKSPNYITPEDAKTIASWVKKGGVLAVLANDAPNCEFTNLNRMMSQFGITFNHVTLHPVPGTNWEMGACTNLPNHPLFKDVSKIYIKEVSSISLTRNARPVLVENGNVLIAECNYGKGYVFAIGDPWIYNEYIDHDRLTPDFENRKAAENLASLLLEKVKKYPGAPGTFKPLPKEKTLQAMVLANKYFMEKWPDVGKTIITDRERPSNIWTRGTYYEGLMALYKIKPDPSYLDYAIKWGEFHKWGLRNGITTRNGDDQCCGQTYIDLYLMDTTKKERIRDIKACIDNMISTDKIDDWSWIDLIHMAMPVFARLGAVYNDNRYFDRLFEMYMFTKTKHGDNGLYSTKDHLWWRDKDFDPPYKEPNGRNCYWSRGNGWVLAGIVRTLEWLPQNSPYRDEFVKTYREMVDALLECRRYDGFWNVSLHDPSHFGGKELTGTSLFTYGIAWGINNGILDPKKFKPIVEHSWKALVEDCLHPNGFLGYVQGTGKEPKDSQPVGYDRVPNFEDFGLGCFLLAGSEVYKLK